MSPINPLLGAPPLVSFAVLILLLWLILWKGLALWKAAKGNQVNWFLALLIVNTLGLLEIVFLFFFAKQRMTLADLKFWKLFQNTNPSKRKN